MTASSAALQVRPERQQDEDAFLRSEGDDLRDHVTLSYKQEPWTGTWWSKNNFSSTGALIIDLGAVVRDIGLFWCISPSLCAVQVGLF